MLRINLLPPERIESDRTPLPRFIIILIGVALISSELAVGAYGYFHLMDLKDKKSRKEKEKKRLQSAVDKYNKLKQEIDRLKQRKMILDEIRPEGLKEKYQWSFAIDRLFTVVDQSPGVWLDTLNGSMGDGGGRGASASLTLNLGAKSAVHLERMTNFEEWAKKQLIEEENVFTSFQRNWRPLRSQGTEGKRHWSTSFTLQKVFTDEEE